MVRGWARNHISNKYSQEKHQRIHLPKRMICIINLQAKQLFIGDFYQAISCSLEILSGQVESWSKRCKTTYLSRVGTTNKAEHATKVSHISPMLDWTPKRTQVLCTVVTLTKETLHLYITIDEDIDWSWEDCIASHKSDTLPQDIGTSLSEYPPAFNLVGGACRPHQ